jgi:pimeloyl-ACP methyl ester carboxylesterase
MPGGWRFPIFRGFDRHWKVAPMPTPLDTVLLPGFDGTGRLSRYFADALPPQLTPSVIAYPPDAPESYSDLEARVRSLLPSDRAFAIVAESFSGPIAIRIAAKRPKGLVALVLVGTFVHNPVRFAPTWMKSLVGSYLFHIPPPAWMVRQFVAGSDAPGELMSEALAAWCQVKPGVLAMRRGRFPRGHPADVVCERYARLFARAVNRGHIAAAPSRSRSRGDRRASLRPAKVPD